MCSCQDILNGKGDWKHLKKQPTINDHFGVASDKDFLTQEKFAAGPSAVLNYNASVSWKDCIAKNEIRRPGIVKGKSRMQ